MKTELAIQNLTLIGGFMFSILPFIENILQVGVLVLVLVINGLKVYDKFKTKKDAKRKEKNI